MLSHWENYVFTFSSKIFFLSHQTDYDISSPSTYLSWSLFHNWVCVNWKKNVVDSSKFWHVELRSSWAAFCDFRSQGKLVGGKCLRAEHVLGICSARLATVMDKFCPSEWGRWHPEISFLLSSPSLLNLWMGLAVKVLRRILFLNQ
jgi:hypothetical protein